jgi:hypothetical protein
MARKSLNYKFVIVFFIIFLAASCKKNERAYSYEGDRFISKDGYYYVPPTRYPSQYAPYNHPSSRMYNNPYSHPPKNYYPYYDSDNYYVPPTNQRAIPTDNGYGGPGPNSIY